MDQIVSAHVHHCRFGLSVGAGRHPCFESAIEARAGRRRSMTKAEVRQQIASIGIIPVIRASSAEKVLVAVDALRNGGIPIVEVTLTVPGAERVIAALRK